jgi:hypothetical protein
MSSKAFETVFDEVDGALVGPWRGPRQMLAEQKYDDHASIHDDSTAQKLGFRGGLSRGQRISVSFHPLVRGSGARHGLNPVVSRRITGIPFSRTRKCEPS